MAEDNIQSWIKSGGRLLDEFNVQVPVGNLSSRSSRDAAFSFRGSSLGLWSQRSRAH
jgi:hypothetical protein